MKSLRQILHENILKEDEKSEIMNIFNYLNNKYDEDYGLLDITFYKEGGRDFYGNIYVSNWDKPNEDMYYVLTDEELSKRLEWAKEYDKGETTWSDTSANKITKSGDYNIIHEIFHNF
jgi:hypothetical protein